ncbi:glyceraldehyde 3-phosphate dehydrogenase [Microbacteriaceae bacterium MWH-Ta3]|nr:glyceraldehyde 3-phosphate dehydrogenase [Microbacteriaceae bacterium MWH-Ta3]
MDITQSEKDWSKTISVAERLIPLIGRLYRDKGVVLSVNGRSLIDCSPIDLVKVHRAARHRDGSPLPVEDTLAILETLSTLDVSPCKVDVAKVKAHFAGSPLSSMRDYLASSVPIGVNNGAAEARTDVVLYGFGRIGRLVARILLGHGGNGRGLRLRAIVVRKGGEGDLIKRASLLRRDSVHGKFAGTITIDEHRNVIFANGTEIQVIYANDPAAVDYTQWGISNALLIDNTGKWRDEAGLSQHLRSTGIAKVLLTAPGKSPLKNIVFGLNESTIDESDRILSAASCTTNAIAPVLKVINDAFGVDYGHVETVHSYTNDQNLIDNFHSGDRRGRSAPLNLVISETGAAQAVAKALPELAGRLTGNAIRVPTPNVSMAILNLTLKHSVSATEVNLALRTAALGSQLSNQIDYIESPEVVSTDFVGSTHAGVVDGLATIAQDNHAVIYVWYDNEYGYSHQVVRVAKEMAGIRLRHIPASGS